MPVIWKGTFSKTIIFVNIIKNRRIINKLKANMGRGNYSGTILKYIL
jgi:hypothetical protein